MTQQQYNRLVAKRNRFRTNIFRCLCGRNARMRRRMALHIEALSGQARWGIGTVEQAFPGYTALPERTEADPWETLGIGRNATEPQILEAYRRLAKEAHPDKPGGSAEKFGALARAKDLALASIAK